MLQQKSCSSKTMYMYIWKRRVCQEDFICFEKVCKVMHWLYQLLPLRRFCLLYSLLVMYFVLSRCPEQELSTLCFLTQAKLKRKSICADVKHSFSYCIQKIFTLFDSLFDFSLIWTKIFSAGWNPYVHLAWDWRQNAKCQIVFVHQTSVVSKKFNFLMATKQNVWYLQSAPCILISCEDKSWPHQIRL